MQPAAPKGQQEGATAQNHDVEARLDVRLGTSSSQKGTPGRQTRWPGIYTTSHGSWSVRPGPRPDCRPESRISDTHGGGRL